ncbi:hypothetical protein U1Q18_003014 [Sarracenia purpurea var. burkii]
MIKKGYGLGFSSNTIGAQSERTPSSPTRKLLSPSNLVEAKLFTTLTAGIQLGSKFGTGILTFERNRENGTFSTQRNGVSRVLGALDLDDYELFLLK